MQYYMHINAHLVPLLMHSELVAASRLGGQSCRAYISYRVGRSKSKTKSAINMSGRRGGSPEAITEEEMTGMGTVVRGSEFGQSEGGNSNACMQYYLNLRDWSDRRSHSTHEPQTKAAAKAQTDQAEGV